LKDDSVELLDKYFDELVIYTNGIIDKSITGEIDLKLLKKVLVRQGNLEYDSCFTYYFPFNFTETQNQAGIKNTKDVVASTSSRSYEDEKKNDGYTIIYVRQANDDSEDDDLSETDKMMLTFAYFYRQNNNASYALQKTKEAVEKMNSFDWYDGKHAFIKKLQTK
jgi:hypothetical protein